MIAASLRTKAASSASSFTCRSSVPFSRREPLHPLPYLWIARGGGFLDVRVRDQVHVIVGPEHQHFSVAQAHFAGSAAFAVAEGFEVHVQAGVLQVVRAGEGAALLEDVVRSRRSFEGWPLQTCLVPFVFGHYTRLRRIGQCGRGIAKSGYDLPQKGPSSKLWGSIHYRIISGWKSSRPGSRSSRPPWRGYFGREVLNLDWDSRSAASSESRGTSSRSSLRGKRVAK